MRMRPYTINPQTVGTRQFAVSSALRVDG